MPIINRNDAADVEARFERIFQAPPEQRAHELRRLFAEVLDFNTALGDVPLDGASPAAANPALPANAERIAQLDGVQALYVPLQHAPIDGRRDADRVRKQDVVAAARRIADRLGDDMLLVFANRSASQIHLIYPNFAGAQPTLRRMVVERGIPQRTAVQQVANIYWNYRDTGSIRQALDDAFDVDPVTKRFFTEYHRIFNEVERSIRGFGAGDAELDAKRTFTQTLFNRLMFIYFMSRKRWLAINHDRDYLNALWRDYAAAEGEQKNFYIDRLRPLFFAGLNNPKSQDHTHHDSARELIGDVPFLNGGLFEQTALDRRAEHGGDNAVTVPDAALRRIMTDLFDKFNFTVQESTPYDVEVAVDPEMLGKVFEELVNDRHGSGSYYTPRAVVSFMCREALKGYLAGRDTALAPAAIAKFIDERDASGIPLADARRVGEALAAVAVVDPACGSGAYLLGMMQELVELQTALYNAGVDPKSLYELKLDIIQRNLYGVDNSDFAVNIAMLRMWLSLAIDYDGERPEPLPNLDLKLVCGDSLLGPDPSAAAYGDLFRALTDSRSLGAAKADYMRATDGGEKKRLREEIEGIERELQDALGDAAVPENIVDWRIAFAEVFADAGGGFDVVIANPPYVRQEEIKPPAYKDTLASQYAAAAVKRSDLYCYFYARGLQALRDGGQHIFVCSNSWLDVGYGAKLQKYLLDNAHVRTIYESAVERQFSTAQINTIISVIVKAGSADADGDAPTRFVRLLEAFETATAPGGKRREIGKTRAELMVAGMDGKHFVGDKWGGKYLRAPDIYHHILDKYGDKLVRLGDIATIKRGVTTGANDFFYLKPEVIAWFGIEEEYFAPVMTSPTESRSLLVDPSTLPRKLFLCHKNKTDLVGTGALRYIEWGESQGYHRRSTTKSRRRWYDLGDHKPPLIAVNRITDERTKAFRSDGQTYYGNTLYEVHCAEDVADDLSVDLNNEFSQIQYNVEGRANFGGGALELTREELAQIKTQNISTGGGVGIRFTESERQALEASLTELVNARRLRAKSQ